MKEDDFYIGWQNDPPKVFGKKAKLFFIISILVTIVFAVVYVPSQQKFESSIFEYGTLTEMKGQITTYPVIGLKTKIDGEFKTVPLVGFGKKGADAVIEHLVSKLEGNISRYEVKLRGTMIKHSGKVWMELTEENESIISYNDNLKVEKTKIQNLGNKEIYGEIVDPKCFFGVMKPGYGKIHRSCAIRCISGGIPPVLAIEKDSKYVDYYFLTNQNGDPINDKILSLIGKKVRINGQVEKVDDWKNIKLNDNELAEKISIIIDSDVIACH